MEIVINVIIWSIILSTAFKLLRNSMPLKIWVIEDCEFEQDLFRMNMKVDDCHFRYFPTLDGLVGQVFKHGRPDGVIIDYMLAGKSNGDQMLKFCKNNHIPAVIVTGYEGEIIGVKDKDIIRKDADQTHFEKLREWLGKHVTI